MRLVEIDPDAVRGADRDVRATRDELDRGSRCSRRGSADVMVLVLDETVLRMAERAGRPVRCTDGGAAWGDLDVVQEVTVRGDRLGVTTTERGKTRTDFSTDDVGVLNHYLLVQFGESWRLRRGLPIVVTRRYPPVPAGFEVRADPRGDVEMSWTADDGRTVTAGNLRFESERRMANVCRVPLPVLEAALLDDSGRPQPLF